MGRIVSHNPARPSDVVARLDALSPSEVRERLEAGSAAVLMWANDPHARAQALQRWADRISQSADALATLVSREVGKPRPEAEAEVARTAAILRYYAQAAYDPVGEVLPGADSRVEVHVRREPLGLVAAITPWNFPMAIAAWKLAPALAYGNAVIWKPASTAIGTASALAELSRPELSQDVLTLAPMHSRHMGDVLRNERLGGVTFTGSTPTGSAVVATAAAMGIPAQAEMGGFNSAIVLDDADLDEATSLIVSGAMGYAGQKCTSTRRVLVGRAISDEVVARLSAAIAAIKVGDPLDRDVIVGPLIDEASSRAFRDSVSAAERAGAVVAARGRLPESAGSYVRPTLLVLEAGNPFLDHETFGPAVAVQVVDSVDDAIDAANSSAFGLCAAVHGRDLADALAVADQLHLGMVRVNGATTGVDFWAPFGGHKKSSYGPREQGRAAREFFTRTKTVTVPKVVHEGHTVRP